MIASSSSTLQVSEFGLDVVQAYMEHIQACAEGAVRSMLKQFSLDQQMETVDTVHAEDRLDDGSLIRYESCFYCHTTMSD